MKVLFLGAHWYGSNARSMAAGLAIAGHEVRTIDITPIAKPKALTPPWLARRYPSIPLPSPARRILTTATQMADEWQPDLLFCFGTSRLDQAALLSVPAKRRLHYSPDDVSNPENITDDYLKHESEWDLIVTTKRHNVQEVTGRSRVRVHMVWSAYDPAWHHPVALNSGRSEFLAGFVGNARPDRLELMERLGRRMGPELLVAGERWNRHLPRTGRRATVTGPRYGEDFSYTVRSVRANLVLLNSDNRDAHTCRSFEVPACGGLVVGERTPEHLEMLEEGTEALFFDSEDELLEVIERVRREPSRFEEVRRRGHRRIVAGLNTYADRAQEIVRALKE